MDGDVALYYNVNGSINGSRGFANIRLIRTYAAGSFLNTCVGNDTACNRSRVHEGGLIGYSERNNADDVFVGNYWLNGVGSNAIGLIAPDEGSPLPKYTATGFPVAVPVLASALRAITTFQSQESDETAGQPSGLADLATLASTGSLAEQDYRWAIEQGNVSTFVAQKREHPQETVGETVTFTRAFDRLLWATSPVPRATYQTRGTQSTLPAGSYPNLGRVWEVCSEENNGYPVLVWEERSCAEPGSNRTSSSSSNDLSAQARAAGLSGDELAAFLASGLTLEQWLAQRLAATGTPTTALQVGLLAAAMSGLIGMWFMALSRRLKRA
jgi:hypothetical protein